jgi:hypothetical protein
VITGSNKKNTMYMQPDDIIRVDQLSNSNNKKNTTMGGGGLNVPSRLSTQ